MIEDRNQRVAVVTGGGSGLGRGITEVLSAAGIRCVIIGRRRAPLQETEHALAASAGGVYGIVADVTSEADRATAVAEVMDRFGRLDILVNNAGGGTSAPLLETTPEAWRDVLAVNLDATFFMAQQVIPHMRRLEFGRIVNVGSVLGSLAADHVTFERDADAPAGPVTAPSYNAAKAGVINLTRALAVAVAPWQITVNTISPGFIERAERPRPPELLDRIRSRTPMRRTGVPHDIGHAVRFLTSDEAAFITAAELVVDGGWSAW
jgi:NAD(P)-dependent dehydrogenase (short-subunit alcohol dehydrogenase family)